MKATQYQQANKPTFQDQFRCRTYDSESVCCLDRVFALVFLESFFDRKCASTIYMVLCNIGIRILRNELAVQDPANSGGGVADNNADKLHWLSMFCCSFTKFCDEFRGFTCTRGGDDLFLAFNRGRLF